MALTITVGRAYESGTFGKALSALTDIWKFARHIAKRSSPVVGVRWLNLDGRLLINRCRSHAPPRSKKGELSDGISVVSETPKGSSNKYAYDPLAFLKPLMKLRVLQDAEQFYGSRGSELPKTPAS